MEKKQIVLIKATPQIKKYLKKIYSAQYHQKNRERRLNYSKMYYQQNLHKFREKSVCDCGSTYTSWQKNKHQRTKKHQAYLESLV